MGGVLIVTSVVISTLLWGRWDVHHVWVAVLGTLFLGGVGFADDYLKLVRKTSDGVRPRIKLTAQVAVGLVTGLLLWSWQDGVDYTRLGLPFFTGVGFSLGWVFVILCILVVAGTSNAVNLTDGVDGLAIGCGAVTAVAYTAVSYVVGRSDYTAYLKIPHVAGAGELTVFGAALAGACLGFLWFNCHPASVFMGDTGSLALGGAFALIAILTKQELSILLLGGVFVLEALSVVLQVASFKLTGKRVFLVAPFHHHLERLGWSESKIVVRMWIVAAVLAVMGLSTAKIR